MIAVGHTASTSVSCKTFSRAGRGYHNGNIVVSVSNKVRVSFVTNSTSSIFKSVIKSFDGGVSVVITALAGVCCITCLSTGRRSHNIHIRVSLGVALGFAAFTGHRCGTSCFAEYVSMLCIILRRCFGGCFCGSACGGCFMVVLRVIARCKDERY